MGQDPEAGDPALTDRRPVVFHHVPKCAGTSLPAVLGGGYTLVRDDAVCDFCRRRYDRLAAVIETAC